MAKTKIIITLLLILFISACRNDDCPLNENPISASDDLQWILDNTTPYSFNIPPFIPSVQEPANNPTTVEGANLGRMLFYETMLSGDNSMNCATCHQQKDAFSDLRRFSTGINGDIGTRQSMALINLGFGGDGFTWDGSAKTIEQQVVEPVPNPIEMHQEWTEALAQLQAHPDYPELYEKAFGTNTISVELTAKAIAQFIRTLVSVQSKNDLARTPGSGVFFTDQEQRGRLLFEGEEGQCFHCHGGPNFTDGRFVNNGLDEVATIADFKDPGLGGFNGNSNDFGKFKTPTLRNIELTPPYMHDGRYQTLEQVINFYSDSIRTSPNRDPVLVAEFPNGIFMTEEEKADLLAYLKTFTDTIFINNEQFSNPFE